MALGGGLGRRVARRDAGASGKRRNASNPPPKATEGRVLLSPGRRCPSYPMGRHRMAKGALPGDKIISVKVAPISSKPL